MTLESPEKNALAYLVIRIGSKWSDVFRLKAGEVVTVGRAPTNRIVIKDERCSRYHAEIFLSQGQWTLRDLESRNGTFVGEEPVHGDHVLTPGEIIRIANCHIAFVNDLSLAFKDTAKVAKAPGDSSEDTVAGVFIADTSELSGGDSVEPDEPPLITHRKGHTKLLEPTAEVSQLPRLGQAATQLCRLAFDLAQQPDARSVAKLALEGLFNSIQVDAGAVLLANREDAREVTATNLEVVATRTRDNAAKYHRVSNFLANTVLHEGEAVLARNVDDDSMLGSRDSRGEITSTSVICAPIRHDKQVVGLIHLYCEGPQRQLDPDDLEFSLAVAENVALATKNLERQRELAENLNHSQIEIVQLRKRLGAESEIIGTSPPMQRLRTAIAQASPSRATVLIRGESGVGKELVARAIHYSSPRKKGPFVCINCAALSETLLESELFGHEKGAFTGATDRKIGKFEAADQGTLMMDEIGEMSPSIQAKFLRALEGHPFERVGGNVAIKVDVRVIAATNRDLEREVAEGKFRRDLYFRLHVVEILVPPLRKRVEDIVELAVHFLERYTSETGKKIMGFTPAALELMQQYRWPGNIRELKNVIERAVVLSQRDRIDVDDLALSSLPTTGDSGEFQPASRVFVPESLEAIERRHILATLNHENWNKSRTATILGIERSTLDRKIRRYELKPKDEA